MNPDRVCMFSEIPITGRAIYHIKAKNKAKTRKQIFTHSRSYSSQYWILEADLLSDSLNFNLNRDCFASLFLNLLPCVCALCALISFSSPSIYSPVKVRIKMIDQCWLHIIQGVAKAKSTQTHPILIDLLGFNYNEEFWTWVIRCKVNEYEMKLCYYYEFVNEILILTCSIVW